MLYLLACSWNTRKCDAALPCPALTQVNDDCPCVDVFDLDYFRGRLAAVREAFPEEYFTHAMALKANSMRGVLLAAKEAGFGAEAASISEAMHAIALGFPREKVIFDSPCKTKASRDCTYVKVLEIEFSCLYYNSVLLVEMSKLRVIEYFLMPFSVKENFSGSIRITDFEQHVHLLFPT